MEFREVHEFDDGMTVEVYDGSPWDVYHRLCEAYGAAWQAKNPPGTTSHLCVLPAAITALQPMLLGMIRMVDRGPQAGLWGWYPGAFNPNAAPAFTDTELSRVREQVEAELTPPTATPESFRPTRRLYP